LSGRWILKAILPRRDRGRVGTGIHEIQYRYREPFLGQTPFEEFCLSLVEIEFEQSLIPSDVQLVGAQKRRSFLVHNATRPWLSSVRSVLVARIYIAASTMNGRRRGTKGVANLVSYGCLSSRCLPGATRGCCCHLNRQSGSD